MWALKRLPLPAARRCSVASMRGSTKVSRYLGWQWSVCRATFTSYSAAMRCTYSAMAMAPLAMDFTPWPLKNSAPPVLTWMMPSALASLRPNSTAFTVSVEVTLKAG